MRLVGEDAPDESTWSVVPVEVEESVEVVDSDEVVNSSSFDNVSLRECVDEVSSEEMLTGAVAVALTPALVLAPGLVNDSSSLGFDSDPE